MKIKYGTFVVTGLFVFLLAFFGCMSPNNPSDLLPGNEPPDPFIETGTISGKILFSGSSVHEGITVTLERTDGPFQRLRLRRRKALPKAAAA